jgi:hypothetical protein
MESAFYLTLFSLLYPAIDVVFQLVRLFSEATILSLLFHQECTGLPEVISLMLSKLQKLQNF